MGAADRTERRTLWGLLGLALALRLALLDPWTAHHPDEWLQYLEGAWRLVSGEGLIPWDVRAGIRSGYLPLLLAGPMWLGHQFAPGSDLYLWLPRLATTLVNLLPVYAAWRIGRAQGPVHAAIAAGAVALWLESALFAVSLLSEALSLSVALLGIAFLFESPRRRPLAAGVLLGLAVLLRPQNAPALALAALLLTPRSRTDWLRLLAGGAAALAAGAAVDLMRGTLPFEWVWQSFYWNFTAGRQAELSEARHASFLSQWWSLWRWAGIVLFVLPAAVAARRHWRLLAVAGVQVALHLLLVNEEYRYFLLGTQLVLLVGALGLADLVTRRGWRPGRAVPGVLALVALGSLWLSTKQPYRGQFREEGAIPRFAAGAARAPGACALGISASNYALFGQALLRSPTPVVPLEPGTAVPAGVDRLLAWSTGPAPAAPFATVSCAGRPERQLCLWARPRAAGCDPALRADHFQRWLERNRL